MVDYRHKNEAAAVFQELDRDKSGKLTTAELGEPPAHPNGIFPLLLLHCSGGARAPACRLSDFGLGDALIELLFCRLDANHDGEVIFSRGSPQCHTLHVRARGAFGIVATHAHVPVRRWVI